jgi:hypothetical protein
MYARYCAHSILLHLIISIAFWISTKYDDPEDRCLLGCETFSLADRYSHITGMYTLKNVCINLPNYMASHPRDSILQSLSRAPQIVKVKVIYYDQQSVRPSTNFSHSLWLLFRQFRVCWCEAPSLRRSRVCTFPFLPGITCAAFLISESHRTHEHSLLSIFFRLPKPGGPSSCIYFPQEQRSPVIQCGYTSC